MPRVMKYELMAGYGRLSMKPHLVGTRFFRGWREHETRWHNDPHGKDDR